MRSDHNQDLLNEVSTILWRERQLLDLLLFKLEEERLVLASAKTKWLHHATREVEMVLEQLKRAELIRAVKLDEVAGEMGLLPSPTLQNLADKASEPWTTIFSSHRQAFITATEEIRRLADSNHDLLSKGHQAARHALNWLTTEGFDPGAYTAAGSVARGPSGHHLVNEAL